MYVFSCRSACVLFLFSLLLQCVASEGESENTPFFYVETHRPAELLEGVVAGFIRSDPVHLLSLRVVTWLT